MNPEATPFILPTATVVYVIIAAVLGMIVTCYGGYRLGRLTKPKPAPKPKTYIKTHTFTAEQTLELAKLWDEMDDGKRLPKVKFWQALRAMVPKEDLHEALELENGNHSRWTVKITKEGDENALRGAAQQVLPTVQPLPDEAALKDVQLRDLPLVKEAVELLASAAEIARRDGKDTNWLAFHESLTKCLATFGRRGVSARTYRIPPGYAQAGPAPETKE